MALQTDQFIVNVTKHTSKTYRRSLFHLFCDLLVDGITEILYGALSLTQDYRSCVVWSGPARFGVDSDEVKVLPHSLNQLVNVKPLL